ncbi:hypothetical protein [Pseudomonas entomophila]|uniref:Uncharacterized protein n=2 Tax=Pseudomonas entomophila TaxID=312306 RepID=Q1I7Q6_PSEE4|nr:hypothetical protein [Pseudomonas entomophila]WMW07918.1 hypothetical protein RAH46_11420 [Pseudomonas entomophila]CAK16323.1 hypothetical protein; putative membrane protein [Pseudomonas entomophila L48]
MRVVLSLIKWIVVLVSLVVYGLLCALGFHSAYELSALAGLQVVLVSGLLPLITFLVALFRLGFSKLLFAVVSVMILMAYHYVLVVFAAHDQFGYWVLQAGEFLLFLYFLNKVGNWVRAS